MASFNGVDLGFIFYMNVGPNPKARQVNAYAGANGLEVIDQGTRGGHSVVSGAIISSSAPGLAAAERSFLALQQDGGAYALVDTLGTTWAGVILVDFEPEGRVNRIVGPFGGFFIGRRYRAEFLHVGSPVGPGRSSLAPFF
jgi:hypothetical protein